ncbi:SDR family NAD(P)-dependent oxidoreductase [Dactylosporangium sucinum]|uniref:Uncharacterized protein n=1 Tax=Dactylosporangium sucinum TaxID=1424081 RepID=A0A917UF52_9ACTN|nr:SDR family NAD(P)-dependent oxidoreductase [Dactylosporangium sucinum]GGM88492.1 hypothetical protein GCM10007977_108120 [Dactylosporangium sucinum]
MPAVAVTAAGAGIGRAVVELFAERGYGVVAVDADKEARAALAGDRVVTLAGDVADQATNAEMVRLAVAAYGRLDAAVLNTGAGGAPPLEDAAAAAALDAIHAVNVRGAALGIGAAGASRPR